MGLVIGQLASLMYASEESQLRDTLQLLSLTYQDSSKEELLRECWRREPSFTTWCKQSKGLNVAKRGFQKELPRATLIEFIVQSEICE